MPFQIKDFNSIALGQINHARAVTDKITDFVPGSVARTLMEAPAIEIEELYLQMFLGLREAIPIAIFSSFRFERLSSSRAAGFVTVNFIRPSVREDVIFEGTSFLANDGRQYVSTADVPISIGQTSARVPVAYPEPGAIGNIAEGAITQIDGFDPADVSVSNAAITSGRDIESDSERESRFGEFVQSLSRGTIAACLYAVRQSRILDEVGNTLEFVTRSGVVEEAGHVRIYAYSNLGVPSAALLELAQTRLDGTRDDTTGRITPGFRPAGVRVDVLPMAERAIPFSMSVQMLPGFTLTMALRQKLADIFATVIRAIPSGTTLYMGTLVKELLAAPGIFQVVPTSTSNISCAQGEALAPGVITIAEI